MGKICLDEISQYQLNKWGICCEVVSSFSGPDEGRLGGREADTKCWAEELITPLNNGLV